MKWKAKIVNQMLGSSYDWDESTNELQYLGNPLGSTWTTKEEDAAIAAVMEEQQHLDCMESAFGTHGQS